MRSPPLRLAVAGLGLLAASVHAAGAVVWQAPPSLGLGVPAALTVQLVDADGGAVVASSTLSVGVQTSSARGEFAVADAFGTWTPGYTLTVLAGQSVSDTVFYRDGTVGTATLTADAGAGLQPAAAVVVVTPLSVQDDFESGGLATWFASYSDGTHTLDAGAAAAHRGAWGLEVVDSDATPSSTAQRAAASVLLPALAPEYHARAWVRVSPTSATGVADLMGINHFNTLTLDLVNGPQFMGEGPAGNFMLDPSMAPFSLGTWHLVELSNYGIGTPDGGRRAWIDGQLADELTGLDYGNLTTTSVELGEPAEDDGTFTAVIQLDDARAGAAPLAGRLVLGVPDGGPAPAGTCLALTVGLVAPEGVAASAPYDVRVQVVSDGGQSFLDPACTLAGSPMISFGNTQVSAGFVAAAPGATVLSATAIDFLTGTATVVAIGPTDGGTTDGGSTDGGATDGGIADGGTADGGAASGPLRPRLGCDCSSTPGGGALLLLWVLGRAVARRRGRRSPMKGTA